MSEVHPVPGMPPQGRYGGAAASARRGGLAVDELIAGAVDQTGEGSREVVRAPVRGRRAADRTCPATPDDEESP
jgi:hypothetical protein